MKKQMGFLMVALCLCATACTAQTTDYTVAVQEYYSNLQAATAEVFVQVDLGDSVGEYLVEYQYSAEDVDLQTILAPESVEGITLRIAGEAGQQATLQYADTVLDFDMTDTQGCSPADGLYYLFQALALQTPTEISQEDVQTLSAIFVKYEGMDATAGVVRGVWLDATTLAPIAAEIYQDENRILTFVFQSFAIVE